MMITINYKGVSLDVTGEYTPSVPQVLYPDGSGYPGDEPEFEVEKVYYNKEDVTEIFEAIDDWTAIEELVIQKYKD